MIDEVFGMYRAWIVVGSLAGLGAVAMAAAAAHALGGLAPGMLQIVAGGVQMQGWHALALLACGIWVERQASPWRRYLVHVAGAAFTSGLLLFCGAVYAHALGGIVSGPIAPIGGTLLMVGWLLLGTAALRR
jgi:uncharacterized membrane protein YgdD (TMEM256/DUF423 family)